MFRFSEWSVFKIPLTRHSRARPITINNVICHSFYKKNSCTYCTKLGCPQRVFHDTIFLELRLTKVRLNGTFFRACLHFTFKQSGQVYFESLSRLFSRFLSSDNPLYKWRKQGLLRKKRLSASLFPTFSLTLPAQKTRGAPKRG